MVIRIIACGSPFTHVMHEKAQRAHDVVTSHRRRYDVILAQMPASSGGLTLHNHTRVYFLLDTLKGEKERLISLYECVGKFEY